MRVGVVLAGGAGERAGSERNKVLADLAGISVIRRSVVAMIEGGSDAIVVVVRPIDRGEISEQFSEIDWVVVDGGDTRQQSEAAGIAAAIELGATQDSDVIAVHDGARPLVGPETIEAVFAAAAEMGAAYPVVQRHGLWHANGLVDQADALTPTEPVTDPLFAAQTPQAARATLLIDAIRNAGDKASACTDTIEFVGRYATADFETGLVRGDARNIKITWASDFVIGERLVADTPTADQAPVESGTVQTTSESAGAGTDTGDQTDTAEPTEARDQYAVLTEVELEVADVQVASECLSVEGTEICAVCQAADADGTLAGRPALARCVKAKRAE